LQINETHLNFIALNSNLNLKTTAMNGTEISPEIEREFVLASSNFQPEGHKRLCESVLKPDLEHADCDSPFFAKKVVFTGVLKSIVRKDTAELIQKMGADIDTTITERTNFVIRLIFEEEFLRMCGINN